MYLPRKLKMQPKSLHTWYHQRLTSAVLLSWMGRGLALDSSTNSNFSGLKKVIKNYTV